jgi:hypothetical protein
VLQGDRACRGGELLNTIRRTRHAKPRANTLNGLRRHCKARERDAVQCSGETGQPSQGIEGPAWQHCQLRCCEFSAECEAKPDLRLVGFSGEYCVSASIRIDDLRVAEATQTPCWMKILRRGAPGESWLVGPSRVGALEDE